MEDILGVKFFDKKRGEGAVITWGKIFEEAELLLVLKNTLQKKFGARDIESIKVCDFLGQISDHPYFYECLISFIQAKFMPVGRLKSKKWVSSKRKALRNKDEILFNGFKNQYQEYLQHKIKNCLDHK